MKKILLTGGGTAGHVTPNLALVPLLKEEGYEICYIGTKKGIEREIIEKEGIPYFPISAGKLRRYFSFKNFVDPFKIAKGYFGAKKILRRERPNIVFSKGGFVTVPVVFAAKKCNIPVVLHESDYTPGLANRLAIPRANRVCVSFESTAKHIPEGKCVVTGAPVRKALLQGKREKGLFLTGFSGEKPVLLIMGGSLGALAVNQAVDAVLEKLLQHFDIIHIRGKEHLSSELEGKAGYVQYGYVSEELPDLFAAADLMLSRAGANAIFEILALSIPALLIPLPKESSRGDQILNASYFEKKGYSLVLQQSDMTPQKLLESLLALEHQASQLKEAMRQSGMTDGAKNVVEVIRTVVEEAHG